MIFGIGTDIVCIERMTGLLAKFGDKAAQRILSDNEFAAFQSTLRPAEFLAKRFAAKEASAKALGTGFRDGLSLRDISVAHNQLGRPELCFDRRAAVLIEQLNIGQRFLSLSDEQDYAIAYVVLELNDDFPNN